MTPSEPRSETVPEPPAVTPSEQESLQVAEAARQKEWREPSFLKELFLGSYRIDLIHPFPPFAERPEFLAFYEKMKEFLRTTVKPVQIDATGEYPPEVIDGLRRLGAFGMKIPEAYGGLGFSQAEYDTIMKLLGSWDANVTALLSAHQSIGAPQPLKLFGTEEQKKRYLPRLAAGSISAFALTEPDVGSDPASMRTVAQRTPDGDFVLTGEKLWCTNGTLAEIIVVMARLPGSQKISAFIVETSWPGVVVEHRCRFMGLKALSNAVISFKDVRVPKENLIGQEGQGLKIALVTLNTGRLALPAGSVGTVKACLEIVRGWANERVQWGHPIGKHEAIAHKIANMASHAFAMEAVSDLGSRLAGRGGYDIRLEAAAAKEFNTAWGWKIIDDAMQIRGGRGYETESSLAARGEPPVGVERAMRDFRINLIFEGSSEIMHLFMAREAVDHHLHMAGVLIDPKIGAGAKLLAFPGIAASYAVWYAARWIGWSRWPKYASFGRLAGHLRFAERQCRRLARETFHGMAIHRAKLQRKQAFLFRLVDIGLDLYAVTVCVLRARALRDEGRPEATSAEELADLFCRAARRRVKRRFHDLWFNDDTAKVAVARNALQGRYAWLEEGKVPRELRPRQGDGPV
ncbi:MAG: acyl-CoA dehydrogenase family protein [Planctomycetes bacterium]|nr:acyl-CoA dehydrogenase family protein [Planctomycetota bacterium]